MGEWLALRVFKGATEIGFRSAVDEVVVTHGGEVEWDCLPRNPHEDFRTSHNDLVHVVYLPFLDGAPFYVSQKVAEALSIPWIELRIQEGSLWDYSLYSGKTHLDNFSTWPEYWGNSEEWNETQRGNPQLLADTWGISRAQIEDYLAPWGMKIIDENTFDTVLRGKAYDDDSFEYGNIWQIFDFLRALGGLDPMNWEQHGHQHRMRCPPIQSLATDE